MCLSVDAPHTSPGQVAGAAPGAEPGLAEHRWKSPAGAPCLFKLPFLRVPHSPVPLPSYEVEISLRSRFPEEPASFPRPWPPKRERGDGHGSPRGRPQMLSRPGDAGREGPSGPASQGATSLSLSQAAGNLSPLRPGRQRS